MWSFGVNLFGFIFFFWSVLDCSVGFVVVVVVLSGWFGGFFYFVFWRVFFRFVCLFVFKTTSTT